MRRSILAIFTLIFLLLSVVFIGFETMEIPKDQNAQIDSILDKISPEVITGHINPITLSTLPPDTFYAIWIQNDDIWQPLIVSSGVTIQVKDGPTHIPQEFAWAARTYIKTSNNINYIVWINKFNPEFYIKDVIIVALFLLLFYLILVLVISVLFGSRQNDIYEEAYEDGSKGYEQDNTFENEKSSPDENKSGSVSDQKSSSDENEIICEHAIDGDQPASVKLTAAEYDALNKPIEYDDDEIDESDPFFEEEHVMPQMPNVPDLQNAAQKHSQSIIAKYKELWQKNIKMSDDFTANFRFRETGNMQKLGITPSVYIDNVLKIGQDYFGWKSCGIYICQDSNLINAVTNEVYEPDIIDIPTNGTKKGLQFVPLFPYSSDELFGYLVYEWNSIKPFRLTDILCYLKLIFSNDTRFIFDDKMQAQIKQDIQKGLDCKGDTLLSILTIDNKERIRLQYTDDEIARLDEMIFAKIRKNYKKYIVYHITAFKYAVIGVKISKEKSIEAFDKWIDNADKHIYAVSPLNNVAVSFSCGIAYKTDTVGSSSTVDNMISRAENLLSVSVNKGGNRISIQK